ncbi:phycocyanobilin lyase beta subunit [Scytonema sp. HK-05]|uniref:HEAT repeat domain-containing protein n=1 Tax=Scytonema sp. HK-05 TaxID=1137095 RepID=UPI00093663C7|nr:HEAT repeat domain-containing protein [Scytonema sp. HK-05]OKH58873.1 phycocyanobilin lyase [Scytonema sp. HK-05]BAY48124.1 phycocyanobilin lyase beta subunit [Scytonema sp. HK-05]
MTNTQQLIRAVTEADSPTKMVTAVQKLAAAKDTAAIPTLIAVFGYNNPPAAVAAVAGLTELGEVAVPQLLAQIDDYNYGARAYSIRALAAIADPRALDLLLAAATTDFAPSVRRAAAKGLGNISWHQLDISERHTAQKRALSGLLAISQDSDWSIRYAAVVGLQALAKVPDLHDPIRARFEEMLATDDEKAVRARVQLAQTEASNDVSLVRQSLP